MYTTYDEKLDAIQEVFGLSDEKMFELTQNDDPGLDELLHDFWHDQSYDIMPTAEEMESLSAEDCADWDGEIPF